MCFKLFTVCFGIRSSPLSRHFFPPQRAGQHTSIELDGIRLKAITQTATVTSTETNYNVDRSKNNRLWNIAYLVALTQHCRTTTAAVTATSTEQNYRRTNQKIANQPDSRPEAYWSLECNCSHLIFNAPNPLSLNTVNWNSQFALTKYCLFSLAHVTRHFSLGKIQSFF